MRLCVPLFVHRVSVCLSGWVSAAVRGRALLLCVLLLLGGGGGRGDRCGRPRPMQQAAAVRGRALLLCVLLLLCGGGGCGDRRGRRRPVQAAAVRLASCSTNIAENS